MDLHDRGMGLINGNRSSQNTMLNKFKYHRDFYYLVVDSISENAVTFLLGPRKCGKTVVLKQLLQQYSNAEYIDFKQVTAGERMSLLEHICHDILYGVGTIYLLDEVTYIPNAEIEICRIAELLADIDNTQTKLVFTGSQSVALEAWAHRAFAGNAGVVRADFISYSEFLECYELGEPTEQNLRQFLQESYKFHRVMSLEEYIRSCIDETVVSNANATNYIFGNECDLIRNNAELLVNICYQTMFTLHNHVNVETFMKGDKLKESIESYFRDVCLALGCDEIADRINESFVRSYNKLQSQNISVLRQAFMFLWKCNLITLTPVIHKLDDVPDIYSDLLLDDSRIRYKADLFREYNITIRHPMFYICILKDILQNEMPEVLPGGLYGSIVECYARGLLPTGYEFVTIDTDGIEREIDYINLDTRQAVEFTIAKRHSGNFGILPNMFECIMLSKDVSEVKDRIKKIPYYEYIYNLSVNRNWKVKFLKEKSE